MVIALVVTPEGLPLAYEVLPGNTADNTTLRGFLERIERQYGKARIQDFSSVADVEPDKLSVGVRLFELLFSDLKLRVREGSDNLVRELVLDDPTPFVPFTMSKRGKQADSEAETVMLHRNISLRITRCLAAASTTAGLAPEVASALRWLLSYTGRA